MNEDELKAIKECHEYIISEINRITDGDEEANELIKFIRAYDTLLEVKY